jgi:HK97 family phage prohead protease
MPMPKPKKDETKDEFIERCMGDSVMNEDYPDNDQRYAVCLSQWEKEKDSKEPEREIRIFDLDSIELRDGEGDEGSYLEGHAAVYGKKSEDMGGWREIIDPGFFTPVLKDDVRSLIDHESRLILGRTKSGTLELTEDEKGLFTRTSLPETTYANDLKIVVKRGDVSQMSFAFLIDYPKGQSWEVDGKEVDEGAAFDAMFDKKKHDILRHLVKAKRLYDVSPVTYPAYPQTDVKVRALEYKSRTDEVKPAGGQEAVTGPDRLGEQRLKYGYPKIKTGELK